MRVKLKSFRLLGVLILLTLSIACATTKMQSVSMDSSYSGGYLKKILIVGVSAELKSRLMFENVFVEQFKKRGVDATASHKVILLDKDLTKERILREAEKLDADAILVTFLLGVKEEYLQYDPANLKRATLFKPSWDSVNAYASAPVTYTKTESVRLSTNIYERKSEKLIWNAITETVRPESVKEVIDSLCGAVLKSARENKLIQ